MTAGRSASNDSIIITIMGYYCPRYRYIVGVAQLHQSGNGEALRSLRPKNQQDQTASEINVVDVLPIAMIRRLAYHATLME